MTQISCHCPINHTWWTCREVQEVSVSTVPALIYFKNGEPFVYEGKIVLLVLIIHFWVYRIHIVYNVYELIISNSREE